jgi:exodeoxyribonuclease-5
MNDLEYSQLQQRAIQAIVDWYGDDHPHAPQEFYLAGYAGTGKSTVVAEAIRRLRDQYKITNIPTAAYTGKAAHVLRKKGNMNAQTIHSLIYKCVEDEHTGELSFVINLLGNAALADLIVLDECSMIDNVMADDLRSFGKKILVMGDPGQLPPINGEGSFTNRRPDFFLDEIHRQAADSPIIKLATMARQGIMVPVGFHEGDVQVKMLTNESADEFLHNPDTQVLCGLNRIRWAVTQIMRKEQGFGGVLPCVGERILCCKNNKDKGLFNGGAGILKKLEIMENGGWKIAADVEGRFQKDLITDPFLFRQHFDNGASVRDFKKKRPNEFDWGYILSVHKAQGSGWPHVTLIDNSPSFREDRWKHLYTGITRAESGLTVLVS